MMLTRCPACATTFRVTPDQLKVLHGKVRCGQCQHVFNALDTLLEEVPEPVVQLEPQSDLPLMAEAAVAIPDQFIENPAAPIEIVAESHWQAQDTVAPLHETRPVKTAFRTWWWALASSLALLVLLLQATLQFRVELGVLSPQVKPLLQVMCKPLGCDLPLPRKSDLLGIESSDLNPDQKNQGQLVLAAVLKNRAPFVQAYPHLELTLTDTADRLLLRKVLSPPDYLPKNVDISSGFLANGELAVNLTLIHDNNINTATALAAGYRLYLFYP